MSYESKLMCPECGGKNVDEEGFCNDCGAKVIGSSVSQVSPVYSEDIPKRRKKKKEKKKRPLFLRLILFGIKAAIAFCAIVFLIAFVYACVTTVNGSNTQTNNIKQTQTQAKSQSQSNTKISRDDVTPELLEFLDSYEGFVDTYCKYMKDISSGKKNIVDNYDEYSKLLNAMSEYEQALAKLSGTDMNATDYAYYIEVTTRVSQKLLNSMS